MKSGVYDVFNKSANVGLGLLKSGRQAVVKACMDTTAEAKKRIEMQNAIDTGAARASIYAVTPGKSSYSQAISAAKSKRPKAKAFPQETVGNDELNPEGVVAVGVEYGSNIEYGAIRTHVSVPPRPFLEPAMRKVAPSFEKYCLEELGIELRSSVGS